MPWTTNTNQYEKTANSNHRAAANDSASAENQHQNQRRHRIQKRRAGEPQRQRKPQEGRQRDPRHHARRLPPALVHVLLEPRRHTFGRVLSASAISASEGM